MLEPAASSVEPVELGESFADSAEQTLAELAAGTQVTLAALVEPLAEPETQVVQAELLVELLVERLQHYYRNPYRTLRNRCLLYHIENKPSFFSPLFNVVNTRV